MTSNEQPVGLTITLEQDSVSATGVVDAPPSEVFDFIRRPVNHAEISGDHSVRASRSADEALGPESRFRMSMKVGLPYRMTSKVVEFDQDRVIAWCHIFGHRSRWELEPTGDGRTTVTETFDASTSRAPFVPRAMGYPKGHRSNVRNSVANVAAHFARVDRAKEEPMS